MSRVPKKSVPSVDLGFDAYAAFASADYESVISALSGSSDSNDRLLLARTLLRTRQLKMAKEALLGFRFAKPEESAEASILEAYIDDRIAGATEIFEKSKIGMLALGPKASVRSRSLFAYYRAIALLLRERIEEALEEARISAGAGSPLLRAWSFELMGWMEVRRKDFSSALDHFEQCLTILDSKRVSDEHKRINALHGFTFIAVETLNRAAFSRVLLEIKSMSTTDRFLQLQTQINEYVAIGQTAFNDELAGFQLMVEAVGRAIDGPFGALSNIELASFFARRGNDDAASLHIGVARRALENRRWSEQDDEVRILLFMFAAESADFDSTSATRMYTMAMNLTGKKDDSILLDRNGRSTAWALYAKGRVAVAQGRMDEAVEDIERARDIWVNIDYRYRAFLAELKLTELGISSYISSIRKTAREFPTSWFPSAVTKAIEIGKGRSATTSVKKLPEILDKISEAEKRVVEGICEGLTSRQIADRLKRSPSTVRNQTISIYRSLGVNTRSALVALVMAADRK